MRDTSRVPFAFAALIGGLALAVGVVVGGMVGNPFDGRASASPAAALSGRLISLGTLTGVPGNNGIGTFPLVDVSDCYQMRSMASSPGATALSIPYEQNTSPDGTQGIRVLASTNEIHDVIDGKATTAGTVIPPLEYLGFRVKNEDASPRDITAWIWCVTSPTYAVGGIGELPPMAGVGDSPSYNYAIAALLAFVAVVAFAAGGWYARRRWGT